MRLRGLGGTVAKGFLGFYLFKPFRNPPMEAAWGWDEQRFNTDGEAVLSSPIDLVSLLVGHSDKFLHIIPIEALSSGLCVSDSNHMRKKSGKYPAMRI